MYKKRACIASSFLCKLTNFFNTSFFTTKVTQVVKFRTTDFTAAYYFKLRNFWCMQRERTLNAYPIGNFTNSESFTDSTTTTLNHNTFEQLNTLAGSFDNFHMYTY